MLVNFAVLLYPNCGTVGGGVQELDHWHQTFTSTTAGGLERYNKGIIHVQKFDCYNILPALKQEIQFDAHEFHLALVSSLMSKADAQ